MEHILCDNMIHCNPMDLTNGIGLAKVFFNTTEDQRLYYQRLNILLPAILMHQLIGQQETIVFIYLHLLLVFPSLPLLCRAFHIIYGGL